MAASALSIYTGDSSYIASSWLNDNILFKLNALTSDGKFFYDDGVWPGNAAGYPSTGDMIIAGYMAGWNTMSGRIAKTYINTAISG